MKVPGWLLILYRAPSVFLLTLLGIPLIAMCLWLYTVNERHWRLQEQEDLLMAARLAARTVEEEFARLQAMEASVAETPAFRGALARHDARALEALLQPLLHLTPMVRRVRVTDSLGRMAAEALAEERQSGSTTEDAAAPDVYDPAHRISVVYLRDHASGEKAVEVASPIREGERVLGAVQAQYRLETVTQWLAKIRIEPEGFLYVVDREGFLVAYPFQLVAGQPKNVSGWAPVAAGVSTEGTMVRFTQGKPGRAWTAAVVALEPLGWRVIAQQPDAALLHHFRDTVGVFLGLTLVLAMIVGALILYWAHVHRATLRLLAEQAQLLRDSEQRRVRAALRHSRPPSQEQPDVSA